jgi:hypothetical protein
MYRYRGSHYEPAEFSNLRGCQEMRSAGKIDDFFILFQLPL